MAIKRFLIQSVSETARANATGQDVSVWDEWWQRQYAGLPLPERIERGVASVEHDPILPYILENLSLGDRVLEAGCGLARFVIYLHRQGYDVTGVDFSQETVRTLLGFDPSLAVEVADVKKLPYADGAFEVYISIGVVEHFEEGPAAALAEAYRVLRPGGRLILQVPCGNLLARFLQRPWDSAWRRVMRTPLVRRMAHRSPRAAERFFQYEYSPREMARFVRAAGFRQERLVPYFHEAGLVAALGLRAVLGTHYRLLPVVIAARGMRCLSPWLTPAHLLVLARR
jgi:SAM-dependent methyltransferase